MKGDSINYDEELNNGKYILKSNKSDQRKIKV